MTAVAGGATWSRPLGDTGRITTRQPWHLLPNSRVVRGVNFAVSPEAQAAGTYQIAVKALWSQWDWDGWWLTQFTRTQRVRGNTIRVLGAPNIVLDGVLTRAVYLARWQQIITEAADRGLFVYPTLNFGTFPSSDAAFATEAAALAAALHPYSNVIGIDMQNESAPSMAAKTGVWTAVRAETDIPLAASTHSTWPDGSADWNSFFATMDPLVDLFDFHIAAGTPDTSSLVNNYWTKTSKPVLMGEFYANQGDTVATQKNRYWYVRDTINSTAHASLRCAGGLAWSISDYDTTASNQYGLFDLAGNERPHLTAILAHLGEPGTVGALTS